MFLDDFVAQKDDFADVFEWHRVNQGRHKALSRIFKDHQRTVCQWNGAEKSCFGVADGLNGIAVQLVSEYVGHTGVIGTAEQVSSIGGENKAYEFRMLEAVVDKLLSGRLTHCMVLFGPAGAFERKPTLWVNGTNLFNRKQWVMLSMNNDNFVVCRMSDVTVSY